MSKLFKPASEACLANRPPVPKNMRTGGIYYLDVCMPGHMTVEVGGVVLEQAPKILKDRCSSIKTIFGDKIVFLGIQLPVIKALLPSLVMDMVSEAIPL